ncbi:DUF4177 domain-containing protein [Pseudooceanicola onchidii]|uniref:DUF4177 domain-containing protein n=1 Tax=Pseudooceanicola onchidii TaxID=2562279 RepID=UPI0010AB085D|nr:DUF4177 domain-containing protein [Pseudooceanicola onchidii]
MSHYEYKVVPAPARGKRGRGISGPEGRFAHSLELVMNDMAAEGWEYQRAETLPSEEKTGLVNAHTVYRNVLVFRRKRQSDLAAFDPRAIQEAPQAPLLLPPVSGSDTSGSVSGDAPDPDAGGLSGLLRRRAAQRQSDSDPEVEAPSDAALEDLASRFAEDAEDPVEDAAAAQRRTAAE